MIEDLLAEYRELAALCNTLSEQDWRRPSLFYGWSAWDEIAHLCYFDETAYASATEPERFAREAKALAQRTQAGEAISAIARSAYGHLDGPALLAHWRPRFEALAATLAALDPKARLNWYGPPMSARSFITARLMETWAHGQDVWDVMARRRPGSARLKHIAHLGVSTYGWSFINRSLPVPNAAPFVRLAAPAETGGGEWVWGDPGSPHHVSGSALDFCLVVTQRRHVADTGLAVTPGPMQEWLHIAQCFAGEPAQGPAPGVRQVSYA